MTRKCHNHRLQTNPRHREEETYNNNSSSTERTYEGGSICNENPFITPSTNALGLYAICQTKDQSVAVIIVHETLFHLAK